MVVDLEVRFFVCDVSFVFVNPYFQMTTRLSNVLLRAYFALDAVYNVGFIVFTRFVFEMA